MEISINPFTTLQLLWVIGLPGTDEGLLSFLMISILLPRYSSQYTQVYSMGLPLSGELNCRVQRAEKEIPNRILLINTSDRPLGNFPIPGSTLQQLWNQEPEIVRRGFNHPVLFQSKELQADQPMMGREGQSDTLCLL